MIRVRVEFQACSCRIWERGSTRALLTHNEIADAVSDDYILQITVMHQRRRVASIATDRTARAIPKRKFGTINLPKRFSGFEIVPHQPRLYTKVSHGF